MLAALPHALQAAELCETANGRPAQACETVKRIAARPRVAAAVQRGPAPRGASQGERARRECRSLQDAISDSEQVERRSGHGAIIESLQQDLLNLRKRYRQLGC